MPATVKLSCEIIAEAKRYGNVYSRSTPKQLEYWARIGKIAEENPDLPYAFIRDVLLAKQEIADGHTTPFEFD